jgi:tetratricopeptide (TPR) repeat protein
MLMTLILCTVTAVIYYRAAYFPFCVVDDNDYVIGNTYIREGLSFNSIKWAFTTIHANNWHPLTWLSLMMDSRLFGLNPMGFHIMNVVFHIITTALVFLLFNSMTGALWRSAFVAALFALHPLHVESVAWIAERKDVLSALFWMLTLLFYTRYVRQGRRSNYFSALAVFALGLMAKPMLVTMPVVLLLLDYWPFQRLQFSLFTGTKVSGTDNINSVRAGKLLSEKLPFLVLSVLSSIVTIYAQRSGDAIVPLEHVSIMDRIGNALQSYILYVKNVFLPFDLSVFYQLTPVHAWKAGCALLILSGILLLTFKNRHNYPYMLSGALWYLITLLPVIGLIQVGSQAMADRYTYIPSIGLFVMASWGGADLAARFPKLRMAVIAVGVASVLLYAIGACIQLSYWKDNVTLFSHALAVAHEESSLAHARMGLAYFAEGRPDLAVREYDEGLRIDPEATSIHLRLGIALDRLGKTAEAVDHFKAELRVRPHLAAGHYDLALALQKIGKLPEAIAEYKETLAIEPDDPACHDSLGLALLQQGNFDEAIQHFSEALRLNPNFKQAATNLQFAVSQKNRYVH